MAALAATGALIVGGSAVAMVGSGNADPLVPLPVPVVGTTYVLPDLAPFTDNGTREGGVREVTDAFGAPTGGGDAALRLATPGSNDKASIIYAERMRARRSRSGSRRRRTRRTRTRRPNPIQFPSLQLEVDFNGAAEGGFSTLTYEPVYNEAPAPPRGAGTATRPVLGDWCSTQCDPGRDRREPEDAADNGGRQAALRLPRRQTGIVVTGVVINQGSGNAGARRGRRPRRPRPARPTTSSSPSPS